MNRFSFCIQIHTIILCQRNGKEGCQNKDDRDINVIEITKCTRDNGSVRATLTPSY
jgi:hypothetical protein